MRKSKPDGRNGVLQKQIVYSFGDHYYFRKELKILNLLTGYIFSYVCIFKFSHCYQMSFGCSEACFFVFGIVQVYIPTRQFWQNTFSRFWIGKTRGVVITFVLHITSSGREIIWPKRILHTGDTKDQSKGTV